MQATYLRVIQRDDVIYHLSLTRSPLVYLVDLLFIRPWGRGSFDCIPPVLCGHNVVARYALPARYVPETFSLRVCFTDLTCVEHDYADICRFSARDSGRIIP